jgi:aminopeptidase N
MISHFKILVITVILPALIVIVHAQNDLADSNPDGKVYQTTESQKKFGSSLLRQSLSDYDVLNYQINLTIDPENKEIGGFVQIKLVPVVNIENTLLFDFAGLQLDSVFINSEQVSYSREGELLTLSPYSTIIAGDTQKVSFYYQGKPQKGLYFRTNAFNEPVVYSHNEPYDAHFWFPCKDVPGDKATSSTSITVPAPMSVLSNGAFIGQSNAGPGFTIFAWQENYPITTYLISIAAGNYQIVSDQFNWESRMLPLQYWVYPSDLDRGLKALVYTKDMLGFFSEFIGDYPFLLEKYAMSEVPLREAAAMENQTATTMGDFVMDNEGIIAHELAHQWWGDALTPETFVDIWLNEGFASYFDALYTEYKYGKDAYKQHMDTYKSKMNSDGSLAYPIYNPPEKYLFGNSVYMKGAWVLHMLRFEVGDATFKEVIRAYYDEYNHVNVRTEDFVQVTEKITGRPFSIFFNQWLNYGGMPIILGDWQQTNNQLSITLEQYQEDPVYQFDIEVLIRGTSTDTLIKIPVTERIVRQDEYFADTVVQIVIDPDEKILNSNNSPIYYIPEVSKLLNTFPNPSQNRISIVYQISKKENVEILIFDVLGQLVTKLVDEKKTLGVYQVEWLGEAFASGSYYCTMKTSDNVETRKITLVK